MDNLVVVLKDTGQPREGLPVFAPHDRPEATLEVLLGGFSGRLLRLYRVVQEWLVEDGAHEPEPAYLLLSANEGGFARKGFYLGDKDKSHAAYVDLKEGYPLTGRWGALDQIFPHELGHVIMSQLAGEPSPGGSNQVHAVSVRTDPVLAFNEGFAEHLQVMAIDDPGAAPKTRALALKPEHRRRMDADLQGYRAELARGVTPSDGFMRRFPMWFGRTEQIERYHAVKENRFAREPAIPDRLLDTSDPYHAYLIENVVPGGPSDSPRPPRRAFSTEGFVSTFFVKLVWSAAASSLEAAYLKILRVLRASRPQSLDAFLSGYRASYPEETAALAGLLNDLLLGQEYQPAPDLWLANPWFQTGTSVFDQHRAVPRASTFDLNAASITDLLGVTGVDRGLACRILERAPFAELSELGHVKRLPAATLARFGEMADLMPRTLARPEEIVEGFVRELPRILRSFDMV